MASRHSLFRKADFDADNILGCVRGYFEDTNSARVDEMELATQIINTGLHYTEVEQHSAARRFSENDGNSRTKRELPVVRGTLAVTTMVILLLL
jgi:hypothetical protein